MSYFSDWNAKVEDSTDQGRYNAFVQEYYSLERIAYEKILSEYPDATWEGSAKELANELGFNGNMLIFLGFLDGVNNSLKNKLDLEDVTDDTRLALDIDFETLLYNMHDAKANWLFNLEEWDNVLPSERREQIAKQYRTDHIAVSDKIGRNDPCPCGSGKKYKKCCGAKGVKK